MKYLLGLITILLLTACQKKIDIRAESISGDAIVSANALYPFACHATSFTTNYSLQAGKVPPFKFTKTQYASGRIKTISMLSRANPNHPNFKQQAWEVIGSFTYYSNKAVLTGTKQLWEYYKTSTGAAAKKSIIKKNINLTFDFWTDASYAAPVGYVNTVTNNIEKNRALRIGIWWPSINVGVGSDEPESEWQSYWETYTGKVELFTADVDGNRPAYAQRKSITYGISAANDDGKQRNVSYQPTQNWVSLEYTICEAMGWVWFTTGERTNVAVSFYPYGTSYKVVQSQNYKNHKYDAKGNLLSYTYADGILQKNTWICK